MKKKYPTFLSILLIVVISACGPAPTPTLSVADVQGTAVANAWIAITQTQAAIPTATQTPIPPTAHDRHLRRSLLLPHIPTLVPALLCQTLQQLIPVTNLLPSNPKETW